jgi:hypothetical protein
MADNFDDAATLEAHRKLSFGASPAGAPGVGVVWLLATQEIERHPVRFYRESKRMFGNVTEKYETLINWVDQHNTLSLRWLQWLGFEIEEPEPWGVLQLPFCRVCYRNDEGVDTAQCGECGGIAGVDGVPGVVLN